MPCHCGLSCPPHFVQCFKGQTIHDLIIDTIDFNSVGMVMKLMHAL